MQHTQNARRMFGEYAELTWEGLWYYDIHVNENTTNERKGRQMVREQLYELFSFCGSVEFLIRRAYVLEGLTLSRAVADACMVEVERNEYWTDKMKRHACMLIDYIYDTLAVDALYHTGKQM